MVELGNRKHLFIDDALVDRAGGLTFQVNPPQVGGDAIVRDRAWEHHLHFVTTVLDDGKRARMWYSSSPPTPDQLRSGPRAYAESIDGTTWTKPALGLVEHRGQRATNLIPACGYMDQGSVFQDPTARSDAPYVVFGLNRDPSSGPVGFGTATSADGFRFGNAAANGVQLIGDSQNQAFWDARVGRYVAYVRCWVPGGTGPWLSARGPWRRAVARWETDDLSSRDGWQLETPPVQPGDKPLITRELSAVLAPDDLDPPDADMYTPSVVQYPWAEDVYIATPSVYRHFTEPESAHAQPAENDGLMDVQLAVSRDGVAWSRPDRRPYVRLDPEGPGSHLIYAVLGLVRRGDTLIQYHTAYDQSHGLKRRNDPGGVVRWTKQRLDGFVSVDAPSSGAELVTKPLQFRGDRLEVNVDSSASGDLRVEIQDVEGHPLPGFRLQDADRILGNHIRRVATWHGTNDVGKLVGSPVRLRFAGRAVKIFAFQFVESMPELTGNRSTRVL